MKGLYARGTEEFTRVVAFSDAVFAIAMTLLVVEVDVPHLARSTSASEMLRALNAAGPEIVSFVISFAVIGRYWVAHHRFCGALAGVSRRLMAANLVYLGCVAFLPYPTALLGEYIANPVAVAFYAVAVSVVSGLEVVMLRRAHREDLLAPALPEPVLRWAVASSTAPVLCFAASVPIAFLSPRLAVLSWLATVPVGFAMQRRRPADAHRYGVA